MRWKLEVNEKPAWPPRCPKCAEQLGLRSAANESGPTVRGYYCAPCNLNLTWQTLQDWKFA